MTKLATCLSFAFVFGWAPMALADLPNPKEDMPAEPAETSGGTETSEKEGNCSVDGEGNSGLGLALGLVALALLGVARTHRTDSAAAG